MNLLLMLALLQTTTAPLAPTWMTVAAENDTITLPAGTVVRYGDAKNGKWSVSFLATATMTVNNSLVGDPDPGTVKSLQVMEGASAISVVDTTAKTTTVVPALPASTATTITLPLGACTLAVDPANPSNVILKVGK